MQTADGTVGESVAESQAAVEGGSGVRDLFPVCPVGASLRNGSDASRLSWARRREVSALLLNVLGFEERAGG